MRMKPILFFSMLIWILGGVTSVNAASRIVIDDKNRKLIDHEKVVGIHSTYKYGHTISRHVNKNMNYLANRCKQFIYTGQKTPHASTYMNEDIASEYIRDVIKRNRWSINYRAGASNKDNEVFHILRGPIDKNDGYAVSCQLYKDSYWFRLWWRGGYRLYFGPQGSYLTRNRLVIKRVLSAPGRWVLLTSHPDA